MSSSAIMSSRVSEFKMIVFDKDGTLGNDKGTHKRWVQHMTRHLEMELDSLCTMPSSSDVAQLSKEDIPTLIESFHAALGFRSTTSKGDGGGILLPSAPVTSGTWASILTICAHQLQSMGVQDASQKVRQWHNSIKGALHAQDRPLIDDLPSLMVKLKKTYGFHIAICTSDDRSSTDICVENWNLTDVIDYSICGDEVSNGKPSGDPLLALCNQAAMQPFECIVVGDTTSDTGMAKNAGAGLMIGVLSGSGTKQQLLASGAIVALEDVGRIPEYLESQVYTQQVTTIGHCAATNFD
ncbi:unnamed protein product [Cylindrotheca closterium]|uniref:Phosphoglycolate phosphatase n=1 Tax=Cylindrotheca closterium TaxID=2856 RepID=A0AAD2JKH1_9STRA|nr:unnamed protein product [Cylindrotheca closterium]